MHRESHPRARAGHDADPHRHARSTGHESRTSHATEHGKRAATTSAAARKAPKKKPRHPRAKKRSSLKFRWIGIAIGAATLLAFLVAGGLYLRHHYRMKADAERRQKDLDRGPRVVVAPVRTTPAVRKLNLPADVRAFVQATIYAKVSGYVKSMKVDKGDTVKKGDVLAVLESPEVDQQVAAAASDVMIKKRTYERYQSLVAKDFVSAQDYDTAKSQYGVSAANLSQAKATQSYEVLRAPFDGTVTLRYVDSGALIPAGSGSTTGAAPLVDLADLRTLRVTLYVQQDIASFIKEGDKVELTADERPDLHIEAAISRITKNLDLQSRAMLCEIWIKNDYGLYPGTFMHVHMSLRSPPLPMIPSNGVMVRNGKTLVALVTDGTVKLVPVETGLDDGKNVQIVGGELKPGQKVALDLPGEVEDGVKVQAIDVKDDAKASTPQQQTDKDEKK